MRAKSWGLYGLNGWTNRSHPDGESGDLRLSGVFLYAGRQGGVALLMLHDRSRHTHIDDKDRNRHTPGGRDAIERGARARREHDDVEAVSSG